jgi:protein translocase SEC61 complex gamma subunit
MVDILERSSRWQQRVDTWVSNRRRGRYMRVLRLAVRPEPDEYINTVKLAFAGLLVLGVTGFIMQSFVEWMSGIFGGLLGG